VAPTIYLAYLNGYRPRWSDTLTDGVAAAMPQPVEPRKLTLDLAPSYVSDRQQYHATLILAALLRHLPDADAKLVGVTNVDLFIPVLTFVFGQSQLNGAGAVVSTRRLHPDFYGLPPDDEQLAHRAVKETVHELGHAFGLVHCRDYRCVMSASTSVEDVDLKTTAFCGSCAAVLARLAAAD
jgi:archaemetzincin